MKVLPAFSKVAIVFVIAGVGILATVAAKLLIVSPPSPEIPHAEDLVTLDYQGDLNLTEASISGLQLESLTSDQPPLIVLSDLLVENLNVEFLGGYTASDFLLAEGTAADSSKLAGLGYTYYLNASNLYYGTVPLVRLPDLSSLYLSSLGGTLAGDLSLNGHKLSGLQLVIFSDGTIQTTAQSTAATLVVCASNSKNTGRCDYQAGGTADDVQIQAANDALSSGGKIVLLEGTYNITATITLSSSVELIGSGWSTILDVSGLSSASAIIVGDYGVLKDVKIQGDITPLTSIWRGVGTGDHSLIEHIWINENDGGISTANKTNVHIRDVYFTQIHDSNGWANIVGASGTSDGIFIDGIYAYHCDRALEVENGAKNFYAKRGYLKTIKVPGSYSFVLDAHTHEGFGGVENVVYEDFYLEDTDGITATGAGSDISKNITFRNITMVNSDVSAGRSTVTIAAAEKVMVDGLYITNTNSDDNLDVGSNSVNIIFNNVDMLGAGRVDLGINGTNVTLQNSRFKSTLDSGYTLSISGSGSHVLVKNVHLYDCQGYGGILASTPIPSYVTIKDSLIEMHATSPGSYGINGSVFRVLNNRILGSPTSTGISISANGSIITGNYITGGSYYGDIWIRSGSSNIEIYQNELVEHKIYDEGTGTKVYRNTGYVTENSGTATVASGQTTIDVTHGLAITPSINDINVVPTNNLGSAAKYWISDVGASTFRINVDVDPGATTATFSWQIGSY